MSARRTAVAAVGVVLATLAAGTAAVLTEVTATWSWGGTLELTIAVDGFARVMAILVPAVAAPVVAYGAVTTPEGRTRLLVLMVAFVVAMELLVVAADLLTLLIAWELIGAISWALISHGWSDPPRPRAANHAFVATRVGDLGLYLAAGLAFASTGSFAFADLARAGGAQQYIAAGVIVAAAAKSAQVPFSPWLFAAMAGPTPVSALLHSATLVSAGAYLLIRLAPVLDTVAWFAAVVAGIGLVTAIAGGVVAIVQSDAKRVLAASTSAQYGFMFVAVGAGSTAAAGAHLVAHAGFKSLLFLGAGIAIHAAGTGELGRMQLGSALPGVAVLSATGALALAAVPPLGGAWTKEQIAAAAAHYGSGLLAGMFAAAFLSALYAARYHLLAYGPSGRDVAPGLLPRPTEVRAIGVLAAATVGLSLLWLPASQEFVERTTAGALYPAAPWELAAATAIVAVAFAGAWALWRTGRLATLGLTEHHQTVVSDWLALPGLSRAVVVDPVLGIARLLARVDDRVIDGGVRATAWLGGAVSRLASRRAEWTFDGLVRAIAASVATAATGSRVVDERGVDAAVERAAGGIGATGRMGRRLQTGQAHHYYALVVGGVALAVSLLAVLR